MDYAKLGLKAGIEIHQQLATHKLFCSCPSLIRQDNPDFVVKRELRPLAGELGKIDPAAIFEKKKRKYYLYEAYNDTTCLVELDEEPPRAINQEALDTVLLISKMLNCKFPDMIQVMRKTVVDGSNTSGFQRTVLVGHSGHIDTSFGHVGIQTVVLEEDSARRTGETPESVTFRLDRLGIPLVEIATDPDCKTPEQVKEVAEKIGMLLRATGKVMRGLGTIRQDVNVSITGHPRIEIKGVQDLQHIPEIVAKEVQRQAESLKGKQKPEGHVRNVLPSLETKFLRPMPGAARMYPETDLPYYFLEKDHIAKLRLPESPESIKSRLQKLGLSADMVNQLATSEDLQMFMNFVKSFPKLNANLIATTMQVTPKEVKRRLQLAEFDVKEEIFDCIFSGLSGGNAKCPAIVKESVAAIMESLAREKPHSLEALYVIMSRHKVLSDKELAQEIQKIKKEYKGPKEKLIGIVMGKLRGKADPQKIIKLLK